MRNSSNRLSYYRLIKTRYENLLIAIIYLNRNIIVDTIINAQNTKIRNLFKYNFKRVRDTIAKYNIYENNIYNFDKTNF